MQDSNLTRPSRVRQLAIAGCAVAALLAGTAARASVPTPVISGTPPTTGVTGQAYGFTPTATGPSGYALRFTIYDMPSWGTFSSATGRLSGTPTIPGTYSNVVIGVTDGLSKVTLPPFNITVSRSTSTSTSGGGTALSISGSPSTSATVSKAYSFKPTATGPSGKTLRFTMYDMPSWGTFNSATGQLSGTPTIPGTYSRIAIGVTDGSAWTGLPVFSITVSRAAGNTAPTIAGTPATSATVAKAYSFTPKASDPDGDALSFSVQNKPSWASFSIASGTLAGTPGTGNVGTASNIVISVSDAHTSTSLAPFAITVAQGSSSGSTGSATLKWTAPTTNTNGSALTDLAGYHIYYGTSPSSMSTTVNITNAGATSYTINNLSSGTWYFAVNAYTTGGTESSLSNTGSKSIP